MFCVSAILNVITGDAWAWTGCVERQEKDTELSFPAKSTEVKVKV